MDKFPEDFLEQYRTVLGKDEAELFFNSLNEEPPTSIRYNSQKIDIPSELERVKWSNSGAYLPKRPIFTVDPLFHSGGYYPQEASSMFLERFVERFIYESDKQIFALDLCAAPGGKSTLLSTLLSSRGFLVANETIKSRAKILQENIIKWGVGNVAVTSNDSEDFNKLGAIFDIVVIDTPCSGEGMFRKDRKARDHWSLESVKLCAARSKRIVANGYEALKEGGILIYSTCTFNRAEDEELIEWIVEQYGVENFEIECCDEWGVRRSSSNGIDCYKFMPHTTKGEGFFIAAMRKKEECRAINMTSSKKPLINIEKKRLEIAKKWITESDTFDFIDKNGVIHILDKNYRNFVEYIKDRLYMTYFGVEAGEIFKNEMKPSHSLAVSLYANRENTPVIELQLENALDFLRKNSLDAELFEEGINMVSYKNIPIGYVKRIGRRSNNLFPKEYRIINL